MDGIKSGDLICGVCGIKLEEAKTTFSYMKHTFTAEVPRCPKCGQVYLSPELVGGRISQVETELEDK